MLYKAEPPAALAASKPGRSGLWLLVLGIILVASTLRAPITAVGPVVNAIRSDTGCSDVVDASGALKFEGAAVIERLALSRQDGLGRRQPLGGRWRRFGARMRLQRLARGVETDTA